MLDERDLAFVRVREKIRHKVPQSYSRAEESARSFNGRRDDVTFIVSREISLNQHGFASILGVPLSPRVPRCRTPPSLPMTGVKMIGMTE
jgi:hypothetical protein